MFSTELQESPKIKFHENPFSGSSCDERRDGEMDQKKVIGALRENANAPQTA